MQHVCHIWAIREIVLCMHLCCDLTAPRDGQRGLISCQVSCPVAIFLLKPSVHTESPCKSSKEVNTAVKNYIYVFLKEKDNLGAMLPPH